MPTLPSPKVGSRHNCAVVCCMKNEGMFALEWVAYHRSIGFDKIFVLTNDCSDGTDKILNRLDALGEVIHIPNPITPGMRPQVEGLRRAMAHPAMQDVAWLLHIDADEFLNVTAGDGKVSDLLNVVGACDAIAIAWRPMGSGGRKIWTHDSVLATQTLTQHRILVRLLMHKCMFRPNRFGSAIDHMPKEPCDGSVVLKNTSGDDLNTRALFKPAASRFRAMTDAQYTWQNADIHHYAVRSEDVFLLKNIRGDGMANAHPRYIVGSKFWRRIERNATNDTSIQRHLPVLQAKMAQYRDDPELKALDLAAFQWFTAQRDRHLTEENRAQWIMNRADNSDLE